MKYIQFIQHFSANITDYVIFVDFLLLYGIINIKKEEDYMKRIFFAALCALCILITIICLFSLPMSVPVIIICIVGFIYFWKLAKIEDNKTKVKQHSQNQLNEENISFIPQEGPAVSNDKTISMYQNDLNNSLNSQKSLNDNSNKKKEPTKLCPKCRTEISKKATICPHCQSKLGISASGCLGGLIFIVIFVFAFIKIFPAISSGFNKAKENNQVQQNAQQYTEEDYKAMCQQISYNEIARDDNAMHGQYFTFSGEIVQEVSDNVYRLSVNDNYDCIVITFSGTRLLEGDTVTVWGESVGFFEGETIWGTNAKLPKINVVYAEISQDESTIE